MSYTDAHPGSQIFECAGCQARLSGDNIHPETVAMFGSAHAAHQTGPASPLTGGEGAPAGSASSASVAPRCPAGPSC